jgi:hypothetical protein
MREQRPTAANAIEIRIERIAQLFHQLAFDFARVEVTHTPLAKCPRTPTFLSRTYRCASYQQNSLWVRTGDIPKWAKQVQGE